LGQKFGTSSALSRTGSLIVGGSHAPSVSLLPALISAFKKSHPHVRVALRTKSSSAIERDVLNSEIEIALVTHPSGSPLLNIMPYRQGMMTIVVSTSHRLAKKKELTLADVAESPFVGIDVKSFVVYPKDRPLSRNARDFLDLLRQPQRRKPWIRAT
ncbi:MAG TPA: LysR substrate-binding domain-containing protein, partial [Candidatus Binatia bacterium]|nr:LysR substrate-binding domain-containing protein [Candidatus Binatia bacterium]